MNEIDMTKPAKARRDRALRRQRRYRGVFHFGDASGSTPLETMSVELVRLQKWARAC